MPESALHVVTGAFSYTGKYITRRLLAEGVRVRTLTNHPERVHEFGDAVSVASFDFHRPDALVESLRGASVLYNTYWVRFSHGQTNFAGAVDNTRTLIAAAEAAGVRRIVHVSIANPSLSSPLPYYRGKALLEEAVKESRLSYAILRPTVIFGGEDVLINNIAWLLRRFPVFAVPGDGRYRMRPIYVEDMAALAVDAALRDENAVIDAVGPETYTFDELLGLLKRTLNSRTRIMHLPPRLTLALSHIIGVFLRDVLLTAEEVAGLTAGLLVTEGPSTGATRLSDWLRANATTIGQQYASELDRHYR
jgi:NADH dehydrogenase